MRTTVDVPDEIHAVVTAIARDRRQSFSRTVVDLIRESIDPPKRPDIRINPRTGLPTLYGLGRVITTEDVRAIQDEEDDYLDSFVRPVS